MLFSHTLLCLMLASFVIALPVGIWKPLDDPVPTFTFGTLKLKALLPAEYYEELAEIPYEPDEGSEITLVHKENELYVKLNPSDPRSTRKVSDLEPDDRHFLVGYWVNLSNNEWIVISFDKESGQFSKRLLTVAEMFRFKIRKPHK